jgi:membrane protein DedA with SNARE-associated domain
MFQSKLIDTFLGTMAPTIAVAASLQEQMEYWLRILSLVLGIAVAVVSLYRLLFKYRKKK